MGRFVYIVDISHCIFDVIITLQPLAGSGNKQLSEQENIYYEKRMRHFMDYYSLYGEDDCCAIFV